MLMDISKNLQIVLYVACYVYKICAYFSMSMDYRYERIVFTLYIYFYLNFPLYEIYTHFLIYVSICDSERREYNLLFLYS